VSASPASVALADAIVEADRWSHRLYPDNGWCASEDFRLERLLFHALGDGAEPYTDELDGFGWTQIAVFAAGRVVQVAPGSTQADADAAVRAVAPTLAVCDYRGGDVAPVAGLLPLPAGALVVVASLCVVCFTEVRATFPNAHFITQQED